MLAPIGSSVSRRALLGKLFGTGLVAAGFGAKSLFAAEEPAPQVRPNILGCWDCGSWLSCCNGHKGTLRATICACGGNYECTFSGTFMKVIPFRYKATLITTGVGNGIVYFRASRQIPMFGGSFSMTGWATATKFHATYSSPKDRGTFDLSR